MHLYQPHIWHLHPHYQQIFNMLNNINNFGQFWPKILDRFDQKNICWQQVYVLSIIQHWKLGGKHQLVLRHWVPDCWGKRIRWIWCVWWVRGLVVPSTGAAFSGVVSGCCCCWIICMRSSVEISLPSGPGSNESSVGVDTEISHTPCLEFSKF